MPIYRQLMERIKHTVETGAIRVGEQLPTIRKVAEKLAMNPNTVASFYRELERVCLTSLRCAARAMICSLAF